MLNNLIIFPGWLRKPGITEQVINQVPQRMSEKDLPQVDKTASIGARNAKIINSLHKAKNIAVILSRAGFHVLDVIVSGRNPRIIINPCRLCETLDGAVIKITSTTKCVVRTMAANIEGVQIEWMVPDEH